MLKRFTIADFLANINEDDVMIVEKLFTIVPALISMEAVPGLYQRTFMHRLVIAVDEYWFVPNKQPQVKRQYKVRRHKVLKEMKKTGSVPDFYNQVIKFEESKLNKYVHKCVHEYQTWLAKQKTIPPQ